jgi:hypothetical protein
MSQTQATPTPAPVATRGVSIIEETLGILLKPSYFKQIRIEGDQVSQRKSCSLG